MAIPNILRLLWGKHIAKVCLIFITAMILIGTFAPLIAPNDPYANSILTKFTRYFCLWLLW